MHFLPHFPLEFLLQLSVFPGVGVPGHCVLLIEGALLQVLLHPADVDVDPPGHRPHPRGEEPPAADLHPPGPVPALAPRPLLLPHRGDAAPRPHQRPADVPHPPGAQG